MNDFLLNIMYITGLWILGIIFFLLYYLMREKAGEEMKVEYDVLHENDSRLPVIVAFIRAEVDEQKEFINNLKNNGFSNEQIQADIKRYRAYLFVFNDLNRMLGNW